MKVRGLALIICITLMPCYSFASDISKTETTMPNTQITRADFAGLLCAAVKDSTPVVTTDYITFQDVPADSAAFDAIADLTRRGAIKGCGDGTFRPDDGIQFGEAAAMAARLLMPDDTIVNSFGAYPDGYLEVLEINHITAGMEKTPDSVLDRENAAFMVQNVIHTLTRANSQLVKPLGCDVYNGTYYVDMYPKSWQGTYFDFHGDDSVYVNILPEKLLYSSDGETWDTLFEDVNGTRQYYGMAANPELSKFYFDWHYGTFTAWDNAELPDVPAAERYSYDGQNWFEGSPPVVATPPLPITEKEFPFGITEDMIVSSEKAGLYFAVHPYTEVTTVSQAYHTEGTEFRYNNLYVSLDLKNWVEIKLPESVLYFKNAELFDLGGYFQLDAAIPFTPEEQAYVDEIAQKAEDAGKRYDKPGCKIEPYVLWYDEIREFLMANE